MSQAIKSIIIGAVIILVIAIILGVIFYWGRIVTSGSRPTIDVLSKLRIKTVETTVTVTPTPTSTIAGVTGSTNLQSDLKKYYGTGFVINYPQKWGLLTCSNSVNLEFDPVNGTDNHVVCDRAVKPITILISDNASNCPGNTIILGNHSVVKSQTNYPDGNINYKWCLALGNKYFNITHRVSASGSRATSTQDYSTQVEQLIKRFGS